MRKILSAVVVMGSALALSGCGASESSPPPEETEVTITIAAVAFGASINDKARDPGLSAGQPCSQSQDGSIQQGGRVVVTNNDNTVVGVGDLPVGTASMPTDLDFNTLCTFELTMGISDPDSEFYTVEFASHEQVLTREELLSGPEFSIGEFHWY